MISKAIYSCLCCGHAFTARTADRARGWARFCSKRCKAIKQTKQRGYPKYEPKDDSQLCFPGLDEESVQGL